MIIDFDDTEKWLSEQFKVIHPSNCVIAFSGGDCSKAVLTIVLKASMEIGHFPLIVYNREIPGPFDESLALNYLEKINKIYELKYKVFDTTVEMFKFFDENNINHIFMGQRAHSPTCESVSQVDPLRDNDGNETHFTVVNPIFTWKTVDVEKYNKAYSLDVNLENLSIE